MRVTEEDRPTKEVRPAVMVARCCCCGVGGSGKKNHRKTAHGDKERLISNGGGGGGKRRPVSGDSAVSNSTFASATAAGTPHDYEVECDARLEGHKQDEDRVRMAAAAADFASAGFSKRSFLSCRPYRKEHARGLYCSYKLRF